MAYINYIFEKKTTGTFICQLESQDRDRYRAVGIYCDNNPKLILDPCKKNPSKLTIRIPLGCGEELLQL